MTDQEPDRSKVDPEMPAYRLQYVNAHRENALAIYRWFIGALFALNSAGLIVAFQDADKPGMPHALVGFGLGTLAALAGGMHLAIRSQTICDILDPGKKTPSDYETVHSNSTKGMAISIAVSTFVFLLSGFFAAGILPFVDRAPNNPDPATSISSDQPTHQTIQSNRAIQD